MSAPGAEGTVARLRQLIAGQGLLPGEKLGAERQLAASLGISRSALREALAVMEESREIVRKIGRTGGIVVSDGKIERNLNTVESLTQIARRQGWKLTSTVLRAVLAAADAADARLLALPGDRPLVYVVSRLRMLNGMPLSVETNRLPAYLFPGFLEHDLAGSFYGLFDAGYGIRPRFVDETLDCVPMGDEEGRLLQAEGVAAMRVRRIAYDDRHRPCELATDMYRADRIRFTMHHSGYVRLSASR